VRHALAARLPVELVALAATAATPFALFLDYRAHTDFVSWTVVYLPVGENAGRPAAYEQIFGLTQAVWLGAGLVVLAMAGWRKFVDNAQLLLLVLALDVLVVVTAAYAQVDSTTALTLGGTIVTYIAMIGVIRHVDVRLPTTQEMVTVTCAAAAVIVLLTIAKNTLGHTLSQRLDTFAFGPAPETAVVLAPLLVLVPAMRGSRSAKVGTALCLGAGLVLTQSRGALIAAVIGGALLVAMQQTTRVRIAGLTAIGAAAAAYAIFSRRSYSFGDAATTYRRENLRHHWNLFLDRPFFGHGISDGSIDAVRAAHNTLLSVADAGGAVLLALWIATWIAIPLAAFLDRRARYATASIGLAATAAVIVGWNTTGSEVLLYDPPTNLLPLMLAVALVGPVALESLPARVGGRLRVSAETAAEITAAAGVLVVAIVAVSSATGITGRAGATREMAGDLRARAVVASQEIAFSSCGDCKVVSLRAVTQDLAEAKFDRQTSNMPSRCIYVAPRTYRPTRPGLLAQGVAWEQCRTAGSEPMPPGDWLSSPNVNSGTRLGARASITEWLATRCARSCKIGSLEPLNATIWKVRTRSRTLAPSHCFYVIFDEQPSLGTVPQAFGRASVSCAVD
jgi:hypothetical protein